MRINILFILLFFIIQNLHAANSLSYSGRLVQASGAPVTGPVNLRAELVYTNATSTVQCSQNLTSVALTKGVFHLKLDLNCTPKTLTQVLSETPNGESVAIRIIDQTNSKTYPLQAIHSVPFSKVAEQLPQMGASAGQALAWDGSKWAPTSVGTGNGTVMSVTAGTGLSGGTITTTGTIGIAAGGITSAELANNSVTAAKINAGEITSTHISATANIPYSKLQIGVGEIPQDRINGLAGSMSALIEDMIADAVTGKAPSQNAVFDALNLKADRSNVAQNITAASVTGLVAPIAGSDAANKTYVDNSATTLDTRITNETSTLNTRITNEVSTINTALGNKYDKAGGVITGDVTLNTQMLLKGGANFVTLKANSGTANYVMTLPTSAGTNGYVLRTDGAGVLSWVDPTSIASGTSTVDSNSITDGSIVDADINASANIAQSKIAGLITDLSNKEPIITSGTATQYWRGNKTWSSLQADVQALILNNYVLGLNSAVVNTDSLSTAIGKLQGQINATNTSLSGLTTTNIPEGTNLYFTETRVLGTDLLGFDNTLTGQIAATDSVLQAFGRTQKQINDINTSISGNQWSAGSGNVYRTSGNVGIGTSTPIEKFEVNGTSKISGVSFKRYSWSPLADTTDTFLFKTSPMANGNNSIIELKVIEGDNRITRSINIEVRNAGGVNQVKVTPLIGSAGDLGLDLKYANSNSNSGITEFYIYKSISRMWTQSVIVSGSSISFDSTGLDPAALTTVSLNSGLQISSTGLVGIGTTNPTSKLQVVGGVIRSDLGTTGQSLILSGTGSNLQVTHDGGTHAAIYNSGGGIQFRSTDGVTNNLTILSSGNVGVGTTAPTQKLDVNGNVKATQFCLGADCKSAWPVGLTSGSVTTTEILDGTIATADIADGAVSLVKLGGTRDATKYLKGDNTWATFATDAINSVLSTFTVGTGTKPAVTNTDTVVGAFGKVQKTLNDINSDYVSKTGSNAVTGSFNLTGITSFLQIPTSTGAVVNEAANVQYVQNYVGGFGQWTKNASNIHFSTGNVGVGVSAPAYSLDVNTGSSKYIRLSDADSVGELLFGDGTAVASQFLPLIYGKPLGATRATMMLSQITSGEDTGTVPALSLSGRVDTSTALATRPVLGIWNYNTQLVTVAANGNMGVGTTTPAQKLSVAGVIESTTGGIKFPDGTVQTSAGIAGSAGAAVAWVAFSNTGTILSSFNVNSVTKNSTGNFTINFANSLSDTNYAVMIGGVNTGNGDGSWGSVDKYNTTTPKTATSVRITTFVYNGTAQDWPETYVAIYQGSGTAPIANGQWTQAGSDVYRTSGNVGIGTTTPTTALTIQGTGGSNDDVYLDSFSDTQEGAIMLRRARGTSAAPTTLLAGDRVGLVTFRGYNGTAYSDLARMQATTEADLNTAASAALQFFTTNAGVNTEKMRISAAGKVGINHSIPMGRLHVAGGLYEKNVNATTAYGMSDFIVQGNGTTKSLTKGPTLSFALPANNDGTNHWEMGRILVTPDSTGDSNAAGSMHLQTRYNNGTDWSWRNSMSISSGGTTMFEGTGGGVLSIRSTLASTDHAYFQIFADAHNPTVRSAWIGYGSTGTSTLTMVNEMNGVLALGTNGVSTLTLSPGGNATLTGTLTQSSDKRLKKNISKLNYGLKEVLKLEPKSYILKSSDEKSMGFIAQDVEEIMPELVKTNDDGFKSLAYSLMPAVIVNAIKEQQQIILQNKNISELMRSSVVKIEKEISKQNRKIANVNDDLKEKESRIQKLELENQMMKAYLCTKDPKAPFCQ